MGASGEVGIEVYKCLRRLDFPVDTLANGRSAGKVMETPFDSLTIRTFSIEAARACCVAQARVVLEVSQGCVLVDDPATNLPPMP